MDAIGSWLLHSDEHSQSIISYWQRGDEFSPVGQDLACGADASLAGCELINTTAGLHRLMESMLNQVHNCSPPAPGAISNPHCTVASVSTSTPLGESVGSISPADTSYTPPINCTVALDQDAIPDGSPCIVPVEKEELGGLVAYPIADICLLKNSLHTSGVEADPEMIFKYGSQGSKIKDSCDGWMCDDSKALSNLCSIVTQKMSDVDAEANQLGFLFGDEPKSLVKGSEFGSNTKAYGWPDGREDSKDSSCAVVDDNPYCSEIMLQNVDEGDYSGLRLVHLLLAAAEAVEDGNRELATVILVRLKALASPTGKSTMERLAAYLTHGLCLRLDGLRANFSSSAESHEDVLAAFQVIQEISPYIKFGHFTANQAIVEAVEGERRVHIVDFDIMEGIQWPSLMQALASRPEGPPHFRITALSRPNAKRSLSTVQETGKRLTAFAASLGLPFSFHQARLNGDEEFTGSNVKLVKGEALAINCMLHLPHMAYRNPNSISSFLRRVGTLNPRILTLVEEQAASMNTFTAHFMETFHHFSAIFDSFEANFPNSQSVGRCLVERIFLGPRICSTLNVCTDGSLQENWSQTVASSGFGSVPLSLFNHCQAKLLLGLFNDGYRLEEENGRLLLGWRSRSIIAASIWAPIPAQQ